MSTHLSAPCLKPSAGGATTRKRFLLLLVEAQIQTSKRVHRGEGLGIYEIHEESQLPGRLR